MLCTGSIAIVNETPKTENEQGAITFQDQQNLTIITRNYDRQKSAHLNFNFTEFFSQIKYVYLKQLLNESTLVFHCEVPVLRVRFRRENFPNCIFPRVNIH